jgi:hypothetical protein
MTPAIVVPYLALDEYRKRNFARVREHLLELDWPLFVASDPTGGTFSPGLARNAGAELALSVDPGLELLVFNDADSIVPHEQMRAAAELALAEPGLVYAYSDYLRLDLDGNPIAHLRAPGSHACVALSVECFDELGGYDERFEGWGYEDLELAHRAAARWPLRRCAGVATHYWHPPAGGRRECDRDRAVTVEQLANERLYFELVG